MGSSAQAFSLLPLEEERFQVFFPFSCETQGCPEQLWESQCEHRPQRLLTFVHTAELGETPEQISKALSVPFVFRQDIMCIETGLVLLCGSSVIFVEPLADC